MKVYVINNLVDGMEIFNNIYSLTTNNIKIGNNISSLENIFPNSYREKERDYLKVDIKDSDMFISIQFNSTNIITKLNIGNY